MDKSLDQKINKRVVKDSERARSRVSSIKLITRNDRDLNKLGNSLLLMSRRVPSSADGGVDMAVTRAQDTLNTTCVVDRVILICETTTIATRLLGLVVSRASLAGLGSCELVGARVAAAREFAD